MRVTTIAKILSRQTEPTRPELVKPSKEFTTYGCELIALTREQIAELIRGGILYWDDGEYDHVLIMKDA